MLKCKDVVLFKFDKSAYDTKILKSAHDTDTLHLYRWNYTIKVKVAEISSDLSISISS